MRVVFALRGVRACVHAWLGEITINICTGLGNSCDRARAYGVCRRAVVVVVVKLRLCGFLCVCVCGSGNNVGIV